MYNLPNCHLSELAVDVDGASLEVQLHQDNAQETKHIETKKLQANQSRHRRPTPNSVEQYRHEGVSGTENNSSSDDSPRGRFRSSTFTPTRTRAPTPHPHTHASKPPQRQGIKTVLFTDPVEQQSTLRKGERATAPSKRKSAMTKESEGYLYVQQRGEKPIEKEEYRAGGSFKPHATHQTEVVVAPNEVQFCNLRRDRRSSIPTPKFAVSRSKTSRPIIPPECLPSPLITQADTAPLRLSQRRSQVPTIFSPALAPAVTSSKNDIPTAARDSSFDYIPQVRGTVDYRSAHQSRHTSTTKDHFSPPPSTSYMQATPKRNGTIRPPTAKTERGPTCGQDSSSNIEISSSASPPFVHRETQPTASLPRSLSTTQSFRSAKDIWTEKSASDHAAFKSKLSTSTGSAASSTSSYHTANSCLSGSGALNTGTGSSSSTAETSSSMETEYIPSVQSVLWNEIMNFCSSDSSSVPPGERYCDCDDCVWSSEKDLKECSTVARAGEGRKCRARRE